MTARTGFQRWLLNNRTTKPYRLNRSRTVNGSTRCPSPVRNHPLKSIVHTSLGLLGWVSAARSIYRPLRWQTGPGIMSPQPAMYLARTPTSMTLTQPPNPVQPLPPGSIGRAVWPTRTISQTAQASLDKSSLPFVAGSSADSKTTTQLLERVAGLQNQLHKPQTFSNQRACFP